MEYTIRPFILASWFVASLLMTWGCNERSSKPRVAVSGVSISPAEDFSLTPATTKQLAAVVAPANASNKSVSWTSSRQAVATVDQTGKVTAVSAGEAIIAVTTTDGGRTANLKVTVAAGGEQPGENSNAVTAVTITAEVISRTSIQLKAAISPANASNAQVTWSSSNPAVSMASNGLASFARSETVGSGDLVEITAASVANPAVSAKYIIDLRVKNRYDGIMDLNYNFTTLSGQGKVDDASVYRFVLKRMEADGNTVLEEVGTRENATDEGVTIANTLYRSGTSYGFYVEYKNAAGAVLGSTPLSVFTTRAAAPYGSHYYELRYSRYKDGGKMGDTWDEARTKTSGLGGYLVNINSAEEQTFIEGQLKNTVLNDLSQANNSSTELLWSPLVGDGGLAQYVWIGASDKTTEGTWLWYNRSGTAPLGNGNVNDATKGFALANGVYGHFGTEPDDYDSNQDAAAIGLSSFGWPSASSGLPEGSLGKQYQWNDIKDTNELGYIVEYDSNPATAN